LQSVESILPEYGIWAARAEGHGCSTNLA
jgi:hypothetical protein